MLRAFVLVLLYVICLPSFAKERDNWLERAKAGDHSAQHNLCRFYLYGEEGRAKNGRLAFRWCQAAANSGISSSQTLLAEMYRFGTYVRKNDATARHYYLLAAKQGHVHAQFMLGRMAILAEPPDTAEACRWLQAAFAQGYEKAKEDLELLESTWAEGKPPGSKGFCETVESSPK